MGKKVELNETSQLQIFRGAIQLQNNEKYFTSEILTIKLSPQANEVVYEVSGEAKFINGAIGCNGFRSTSRNANLLLPNISTNITIKAGWTKSYNFGVKVTPEITLYVIGKNDDSPNIQQIQKNEF